MRVGVGAVILVLVARKVDPGSLRTPIEPGHIGWSVAALGFLALNVYVAAWRWQLLLHALGVDERIGPLLRAIYVGAFYNLVLPGQLGGQAIKIVLLGRRSPALAAIIASVAMDQVIVFVALFCLATLSAVLAPGVEHRAAWTIAFGLTAAVACCLLAAVVAEPLQGRLLRRVARWRRLHWLPESVRLHTGRTWRSLAGYGRQPLLLVVAVAQAVVFFLTLAGMAVALGRGLGIDISPAAMLFVLVLGLVAGVAPFTLAGLGTREAAFVAALGAFGVGSAVGAAFAVLWLLLNSLADLLGAALQFWHPPQTGTLRPPAEPA